MKKFVCGLTVVLALETVGMLQQKEDVSCALISLRQATQGLLTQQPFEFRPVLTAPNQITLFVRQSMALPHTKKFLELEHHYEEECSFPVYDVTFHIGGKNIPGGRVVDKEHPVFHQKLILSTVDDDQELRTEQHVRVFTYFEVTEHCIKEDTLFLPYRFTDREEDRWDVGRRFVVRDYVRSDRTVLSVDLQSFPHQTRILSAEDDDEALATWKEVETFVTMGECAQSIMVRRTSEDYPFTEREEDRPPDRKLVLVRDYRRGEGGFSRDCRVFPYQERAMRVWDEDPSLSIKTEIEIFVTLRDIDRVLRSETRSTPYPFTDRQEWRDAHKVLTCLREYRRHDGSILTAVQGMYPYQERILHGADDDNTLARKVTKEIFAQAQDQEWIRGVEVTESPYSSQTRREYRPQQDAVFLVRDYTRSSGTSFSRDVQAFSCQRREASSVEDDGALATKKVFEVFALIENAREVVQQEEQIVPYPCRISYRDNVQRSSSFLKDIVDIWHMRDCTYTRGNGTQFTVTEQVGHSHYENGSVVSDLLKGAVIAGAATLGGPGAAAAVYAGTEIVGD
ncbi:MAG: hypothetical protein LBJ70_05850 [Holosporales bacterium]|jgi:hypothetical protein|nr:hypothetical protein [Holosporales bacterium]